MPNERTPLLQDVEAMAQSAKPDLLHIAKIIGALQAGKLPSQSQVDSALSTLTSKTSILSPERRKGEGKLSENGRLILEDVKLVLQKLQVWLGTKNKGNVLQEVFYHAQRASVDADGDVDIGKSALYLAQPSLPPKADRASPAFPPCTQTSKLQRRAPK